jgi:cytidine deaminase
VPYSKTRAGTAVRSARGEIFAGAALENAAYNPALPPLQAALVSAFAGGCKPEDVREVVLCQERGGRIDYAPQMKDLTEALSDEKASFRTILL